MQKPYAAAYACLMQTDIDQKLACAHQLYADWQAGYLVRENTLETAVEPIPVPGRPY